MAFDKNAWDPTPFQFTVMGMSVGWIAALAIEFFLFGQEDVSGCLGEIVDSVFGGQFGGALWNRLLLWFVIPFAVFYVPMKLLKKPWRKYHLLLMTILLVVALVVLDLGMRVF